MVLNYSVVRKLQSGFRINWLNSVQTYYFNISRIKIHIPNYQSVHLGTCFAFLSEFDFENYMPEIMNMKKKYGYVYFISLVMIWFHDSVQPLVTRIKMRDHMLPTRDMRLYENNHIHVIFTVMLELWGMRGTPLLPSLLGPLWVLAIGEIELNCQLMLNWIIWNRTVLTFNWV